MKRSLRLAAVALASLFVLPLQAANVDPLWAKVVAQTEETKKWAAQDIDMTVDGDDGSESKKAKTHSQLTGWENGKPLYKTTRIEPAPDASKKSSDTSTDQVDKMSVMTDGLFKNDTPVVRKDGQQFEGKPATLFVVDQSKGPADLKMQVWVDPASGNIFKIHTYAHVTLIMDMNMIISYKPHASGIHLQNKTDLKIDVLVPFKNARVVISNTATNWVKRPI